MRRADGHEALLRAAAPAMAAIEEDERRAPPRLRPIFAAIRELLFVPDLDLEQIQDAAGCPDPEVWSDLREEVGERPRELLRNLRLETAAHLLIETKMSIKEIGERVGYTSISTFRGRIGDFLGMPASQYRRRAPRLLEHAAPPAGAGTRDYWQRMLDGGLDDAEARTLDTWLERLAPGSAAPGTGPDTDDPDAPWRRTRERVAEGMVYTLNRLTFPYQRRLARDAVAFPDLTLFDRLGRESRAADDPERGVEWALLAVDSLAANRMLETHPQNAALAYARLALARWRAGDNKGAVQDVMQSMQDAERASDGHLYAAPAAERSRITAAFYWHAGRPQQALTLAEGTVGAHRIAAAPELGKSLLLRAALRAAVADLDGGEARRGLLESALADLEEARGHDADHHEPLAVFGLWLRILVLLGAQNELAAALPQARRQGSDLGDTAAPLLHWFAGHCSSTAAEPSWRQSRDLFAAASDELWTARLSLDLARLRLDQGHARDASAEAARLVSDLSGLAQSAEDSAPLRALARSAATADGVTVDELDAVERVWKRLEWDRRGRRAIWYAS
ncbi:MAG: helix-turn-helix transcriptional regulator [bacterium]|nr:helix-turn-helix transcriptional regulator [bacterium]